MHPERFDDQWTACRPRAMHLSQQRLVRPKHVAGHRLHIPRKVILLQTWGFFLTLSARETNDTRQPLVECHELRMWAWCPEEREEKKKTFGNVHGATDFGLMTFKRTLLILSQKAVSKMILFFQNLIWSFKSSFLRTHFSPFYILFLLFLPQGNRWTSNKYAQYLPDFLK